MTKQITADQIGHLQIFGRGASKHRSLLSCPTHEEQLRSLVANNINTLVHSRFFQQQISHSILTPDDLKGSYAKITLKERIVTIELMKVNGSHLTPSGKSIQFHLDKSKPDQLEVLNINRNTLQIADLVYQNHRFTCLNHRRHHQGPSLHNRTSYLDSSPDDDTSLGGWDRTSSKRRHSASSFFDLPNGCPDAPLRDSGRSDSCSPLLSPSYTLSDAADSLEKTLGRAHRTHAHLSTRTQRNSKQPNPNSQELANLTQSIQELGRIVENLSRHITKGRQASAASPDDLAQSPVMPTLQSMQGQLQTIERRLDEIAARLGQVPQVVPAELIEAAAKLETVTEQKTQLEEDLEKQRLEGDERQREAAAKLEAVTNEKTQLEEDLEKQRLAAETQQREAAERLETVTNQKAQLEQDLEKQRLEADERQREAAEKLETVTNQKAQLERDLEKQRLAAETQQREAAERLETVTNQKAQLERDLEKQRLAAETQQREAAERLETVTNQKAQLERDLEKQRLAAETQQREAAERLETVTNQKAQLEQDLEKQRLEADERQREAAEKLETVTNEKTQLEQELEKQQLAAETQQREAAEKLETITNQKTQLEQELEKQQLAAEAQLARLEHSLPPIEKFFDMLENKEREIAGLAQQIIVARQELASARGTVEQQGVDLEEQRGKIGELERMRNNAIADKKELEKRQEMLLSELEEKEGKLKAADKQLKQLQGRLTKATDDLEKAQRATKKAEEESKALDSQKQKLAEQLKAAADEKTGLEETLAYCQEEIRRKENELFAERNAAGAAHKQAQETIGKQQEQIDGLSASIEAKQEEVDQLKKTAKTTEKQIASLEKTIKDLSAENEAANQYAKWVKEQLEKETDALTALREQHADLETKLQAASEETMKFKEEKAQWGQRFIALEQERDKATSALETAREEAEQEFVQKFEQIKSKVEPIFLENGTLKAELETAQAAQEPLRAKIAEQEASHRTMQDLLEQATQKQEKLTQEVSGLLRGLEQERQDHLTTQQKYTALEEESLGIKKESDRLLGKTADLRGQQRRTQEELELRRQAQKSADSTVSQLQDEIARLKGQIEQLMQQTDTKPDEDDFLDTPVGDDAVTGPNRSLQERIAEHPHFAKNLTAYDLSKIKAKRARLEMQSEFHKIEAARKTYIENQFRLKAAKLKLDATSLRHRIEQNPSQQQLLKKKVDKCKKEFQRLDKLAQSTRQRINSQEAAFDKKYQDCLSAPTPVASPVPQTPKATPRRAPSIVLEPKVQEPLAIEEKVVELPPPRTPTPPRKQATSSQIPASMLEREKDRKAAIEARRLEQEEKKKKAAQKRAAKI